MAAKFPPSFLVLYSNDSAHKLRIPTPVLKEHRDFVVGQILVALTTESGACWDVDVERIGGDYYFTNGWSDFVNDTNVVEGKHLLFHIVDDTTLQVSMFGDHCWSEVLKVKPLSETAAASTWRFVKQVKKSSGEYSRMYIPLPFAEGTGIAASGRMMLEGEDGRQWLIKVKKYRCSIHATSYSMNVGWLDFVKGYKLQWGDILLFELVPDSNNVVKARVLEKKAGKKLMNQSTYGGFLRN